jgi:hypothetical protein
LIGWQLSIWNCCKPFFSLPYNLSASVFLATCFLIAFINTKDKSCFRLLAKIWPIGKIISWRNVFRIQTRILRWCTLRLGSIARWKNSLTSKRYVVNFKRPAFTYPIPLRRKYPFNP